MMRVIGCLAVDHDLTLVLLAAAVCAFGTVASMVVSSRVIKDRYGRFWLMLVAICGASTVWATHFLSMLAYQLSVPVTYDHGLTAASFLAGVLVMAMGLRVVLRKPRDARFALVGGAVVGLGASVLHYIGMAALQFPGQLRWDLDLVAASLLFSSGFGAAGVYFTSYSRHRYAREFAAVLFIAMVLLLHFTAMGAVRLELVPIDRDVSTGISRYMLVIGVIIAALTVLLIGMVSAIVHQKVTRRLADAERFRTLADGALEALVVHRNGIVIDANAAARRMFSMPAAGDGQSIWHWFERAEAEKTWERTHKEGEPFECTLMRADGSPFPAAVCRRGLRLVDGGAGELLAIIDLTARKESEARIEHLALHDPLTDLPNRRLFMELANKSISNARRDGERLAVLTLDLDGFKLVNDMHGHNAGDELLKIIGQRIAASVRESDVFARFGGDEFAILQRFASQPEQAAALAERLLETIGAPIRLQDAEVSVSASIGVALYPDDGRTAEELLRSADTAMYRAKADGKSTCRFFEPEMDKALEARRGLEVRLRQAIAEERLEVAFQPLVASGNYAPLGFEALLRWTDAELGPVAPAAFIPVAEETGLIVQIGELVLRRACHEAMRWPRPLHVAVNLSVVQFRRKGLIEMVQQALEESGLAADRLELEVTESLLIDNRDEALRTLAALQRLGIRIALDDFGTGFSSLSYLQCFPFDKIKIDPIFVSHLEAGSRDASIVRAVASMARSLNMRVVAEGVETAAQARLLKDLDCDELQGYLIAKPMAAADVEKFLQTAAQDGDLPTRRVA